jgi:hypothetical protein
MESAAIESLVFAEKSKTELIDETIISLQSMLYETFSKKGDHSLKHEFPINTIADDLGIKLDNVVIYIESLKTPELSIEVILDIFIKNSNYELGKYSHIFNEEGSLVDELLVIN